MRALLLVVALAVAVVFGDVTIPPPDPDTTQSSAEPPTDAPTTTTIVPTTTVPTITVPTTTVLTTTAPNNTNNPCPEGYHLEEKGGRDNDRGNGRGRGRGRRSIGTNPFWMQPKFTIPGNKIPWPCPENPKCVPDKEPECDWNKVVYNNAEPCSCFPKFAINATWKKKLCPRGLESDGCKQVGKSSNCKFRSICTNYCKGF